MLTIAMLAGLCGMRATAATLIDAVSSGQPLAQANAALQAGEADKALDLLATIPPGGPDAAEAANLACRVRFALEQWDAAIAACQQAVKLDENNSGFHLWLGRAYGEKAARASFLTAFSLAKLTRSEFEIAVKLDPRNVEALSDLGTFDRQAPGIVGGGMDKAQALAAQLDNVDPARAHKLRGNMAEQQKDFVTAENEYRQAISAAGSHAADRWADLAGFYARRQRYAEMEQAMHSVINAAMHDKRASGALYDCAGLLIEAHQDPAFAATLLQEYLDSSDKTEQAPAFIAHLRLSHLKQQLGDPAAAERERSLALALAQGFKPSPESKQTDSKQMASKPPDAKQGSGSSDPTPQQARY